MLRNIFERRFGLTELEASTSAAYLLERERVLVSHLRNYCGQGETREHRSAAYDRCIYFDTTLFLLDDLASDSDPYTLASHCLFRSGNGFSPRRSSQFPLFQALTFCQSFWWLSYLGLCLSSMFLRPLDFTKVYVRFGSPTLQY
jgi:hypothetical protein